MSKLLHNRALIKLISNEEKTAEGFVLSKEKDPSDFMVGQVVELGTGKSEDGKVYGFNFKVGDKVIFRYGIVIPMLKKEFDASEVFLVEAEDVIRVID